MHGLGQGMRGRVRNVGGGWNMAGGCKRRQRRHIVIYRVAATYRCTWGYMGRRGEGVGGVWDMWIAAVVGWLHGQLVGGYGQCN